MSSNRDSFRRGLVAGIPIAMGYFAVAFSLGFMAKKVGLNPLQGFISSFLNHASAGEYAEFTVIAANASYFEMAMVIFITNARYLLMSCAFSQRFAPGTGLFHRILVGFGITDEIFGASIANCKEIEPFYNYGAMLIAFPSWAAGTALGIIAGNILPASVVSALSVALYGMFLAVIIPPCKTQKLLIGIIGVSFAASYAFEHIPGIMTLSGSMRTCILTVIISAGAAILFPVKEDGDDA